MCTCLSVQYNIYWFKFSRTNMMVKQKAALESKKKLNEPKYHKVLKC